MLRIGVGTSAHRNPERAGREAAERALAQAGVTSCDFVMMFSTVGYDQAVILNAVRRVTGNAQLSGCSGEGVIAQGVGNESSHVVSVMVWKSDELRFSHGKAQGLAAGVREVGAAVAQQVNEIAGDDALALFLFPDGLKFNTDQFSEGFARASRLRKGLKIAGGLAGDDFTLTKTYQYHDGEVFSEGVSWALLQGKGEVVMGVTHGCVPLGAEAQVSRAEEDVIYEIDGRPATNFLNEYLAPEDVQVHARSLGASLSLGFKAPREIVSQYDEYVIRGLRSRDEATGVVALYANVPGQTVRLMRRDPEKMAQGIDELIARMKSELGDRRPAVVLQFECLARGKHMFREEDKMSLLKMLQAPFGGEVPWIGFYCYGEIAPVGSIPIMHHNYTTVMTVIA
jgi:hypothetical protein